MKTVTKVTACLGYCSWTPTRSPVSSFRPPQCKRDLDILGRVQQRATMTVKGLQQLFCESWDCSARRRTESSSLYVVNTWREAEEKIESGSSKRCPVWGKRQWAQTGTWGSFWLSGNTSVLCECQSTGTSFPERLWSLLSGDLLKLPGHGPEHPVQSGPPWAGVGHDGLQRSFPTSVILWFCEGTLTCNAISTQQPNFWFTNPAADSAVHAIHTYFPIQFESLTTSSQFIFKPHLGKLHYAFIPHFLTFCSTQTVGDRISYHQRGKMTGGHSRWTACTPS